MKSEKNISMQCLRAIAVILVVMQHYKGRLPTTQDFLNLFTIYSPWAGVDIFLAISGFLICNSIRMELQTNKNKLVAAKKFSLRRIKRLIPALLVGLVVSVIASLVAKNFPNHDIYSVTRGAFAAIFGVANFYWSACVNGGLTECGTADFNGVTWSLSLEWQLYAFAFLSFAYLGIRKGLMIIVPICLLLSILSAPSFSFLWVTRGLSFFLGCLLADTMHSRNFKLPKLVSILFLILGLTICLTAPAKINNFAMLSLGVGSFLCLLSVISDNIFSPNSLVTKIMIWIGDRSYSIYLLHLPIIHLIRELIIELDIFHMDFLGIILGLLMSIPVIAIASNLSYIYIEQHFLGKSKNIDQKILYPST